MKPGNINTDNPIASLTLFGAMTVRFHDGTLMPALRTRKGYYLLALLVLRAGREIERSCLAETLWPDSDEGKARENLNRTLTDLLSALGEAAVCIEKPNWHTLRFQPSAGVWTDVTAFDAAIQKGMRDEGGEMRENAFHSSLIPHPSSLQEAVALYAGPLLEGCEEDWVLPERVQREQAFLAALETLAQEAVAEKKGAEAVGYLRRVIAADPLRENAQRSLMEALAQEGNVAAVMQVYRDFRLYLRREMALEPAPETQALYEQLRRKARDVQAACLPPPEAAPSPPIVLPYPLTSFIGREEEIARLTAHLDTARLITLTGTGGVGKTRLAIEVARKCREQYPQGIWFIDLAPLSDSCLIPQAIAKTLSIREETDRSPTERLIAALHSRRLLLLLDNCEHLLDACATLAARLLDACPQLCLLATSRQALGIGGEVTQPVSSLSLPAPKACPDKEPNTLSCLMKFEAVRLFVERAAQVSSVFRLTVGNAHAIARLCRRLDGIPLALELAAARTRTLSVEQIASHLDDRFRLLTGGSRAALPRQQTLRATMDWSYDLLTEAERTLFRRLSVFAGGWTLEAAEAVCAGSTKENHEKDILDLLDALVDKSLVRVTEEENGERRYWLLETAREYGRERLLEAGEEAAVRGHHRDYFLALAEEAEPHLMGAEQTKWVSCLEREHDNLHAALAGSVEAEARLRMAGALWRFWMLHNYLAEGRGWLADALEDGKDAEPAVRAKALGGVSILAAIQKDFDAAHLYMEEYVALQRQFGNQGSLAHALNNLGRILLQQEKYTEARPPLEESLAIKRELQDQRGIAQSLNNLGAIVRALGDYAKARLLHQEGLAISRQSDDRESIAWGLINLGSVAHRENKPAEAYTYVSESLKIYAELGDHRSMAACLDALAEVDVMRQRMERAVHLFGAAESLCAAIGVPRSPGERERFENGVAAATALLGEAGFQTAWEAGYAMTAEEAVACALNESVALP